MEIKKYPFNAILKKHIDHFSYNENMIPRGNEFIPVIPDGMTELVINLGDPYERRTDENAKIEKMVSSHFIGIKSKPHFIRTNNSTKTFRVRFKPGTISLFIKYYIPDITDMIINAEELFSKRLSETLRKIEDSNDTSIMFSEAEKFLMNSLTEDQRTFQIFEMTKLIYNNPSFSKMDILKEKTGMDYKQLERTFNRYLGLHPKYFMNIVKFNFATKQMYLHPQKPLTQIALECGYYDQSHFIRTFKQFSGQRPKDYLPLNSLRKESHQVTINRQFKSPSSSHV